MRALGRAGALVFPLTPNRYLESLVGLTRDQQRCRHDRTILALNDWLPPLASGLQAGSRFSYVSCRMFKQQHELIHFSKI
jgi:hypothetical protein